MDLPSVMETVSYGFDYCNCYTNIVLPEFSCYQTTCFCCLQPDAICLTRTIKYDLLQLQKAHAALHSDSAKVAKAERQMNSLTSKEFKARLKTGMRDRLVTKCFSASRENKRLLTRTEKILVRRTMEEKIRPGQIMKHKEKQDKKHKTKESRKKQITLETTLAEMEFEKARLKKLEDEEKRKENNINKIKPKKKGPKTHFRKSKKPGRA